MKEGRKEGRKEGKEEGRKEGKYEVRKKGTKEESKKEGKEDGAALNPEAASKIIDKKEKTTGNFSKGFLQISSRVQYQSTGPSFKSNLK